MDSMRGPSELKINPTNKQSASSYRQWSLSHRPHEIAPFLEPRLRQPSRPPDLAELSTCGRSDHFRTEIV